MSIEFQLRTNTLVSLTRRTLRQALRSACIPAGPGLSIDHIDVSGSGISVQQAGTAVELRVPADVFIVQDTDLFAAPNATPQGATAPAGSIVFPVRLEVQTADEPAPGGAGTRRRVWLRLVPQPPLLGPLHGPLGPMADALLQALTSALPSPRVEITRLVEILKAGDLDQASVAVGDGVVAVRFGAGGAVSARLAQGQMWGMFASGDAITRMVRGLIEPHLRGALSVVSVEAGYHHDGTTPRVDVTAGVMLDLFGARLGAEVLVSATVQLLPGAAPVLRVAVNWSVDVDTALLIPILGPVAALSMAPVAEAIATDIVSDALDVTSFGATPTGDTSFVLDAVLPPLRLGLATLRYDSLVADDSGMMLGGTVLLGAVAGMPFSFTASAFGRPSRIQICSLLAKTGSGNPSHETASLANTTVFASADFQGVGRFCRIELRSPGAEWLPFVSRPSDGSIVENGAIDVRMNYGLALSLPAPMRLLVRTSRGVRLVDFGMPPPPSFDAQGRLKLVVDAYHPDCLLMVARERGRWGIGWRWRREDFRPVPFEHPDWAEYLREGRGVIVQLVTLSGLDAGEFVRFRSATHMIHATADAEGRLAVPVLQPLQPVAAPAFLERVDGRSLRAHVMVETAAFEPVAALPGTLAEPASVGRSGGLRLLMRTAQGLVRHAAGPRGTLSSVALNPQPLPPVEDGNPAALNPQPLPPVDDLDIAALNPQPLSPVEDGSWPLDRVNRLGLQGVRRVAWVPGFTGRSIALADVGGDGHLLLDVSRDPVRVAGTLVGPFGALTTSRHFAYMETGQQVVLFKRMEVPVPMPDVVRPCATTPRSFFEMPHLRIT